MAELNKKVVDDIVSSLERLNNVIIGLDNSYTKMANDFEIGNAKLKASDITVDSLTKSQKELDGSTKKLTATEKEQQKATSELEKQRQKGIAAMKKAAQKEAELEYAIKKEVKSEDDLIKKTNALVAVRRKLDVTTDSGKRKHAELTAEINKNTNALKKSDLQIGRSQRNVGNYRSALTNAKGALTGMLGAFGLTGGLFAFVGLMKKAVGTTIEFEKSFTNVITLLDKADKNKFGGMLRQGAADIIADFGFSVTDTNKALFDTISAGVPAGEAIEFLRKASELAIGGVTDLSVAVDGVTSVVNAYGLGAGDVSKVTAAFFSAQKFGKTTVAELSDEIGKVAPIAKTAGVSYQELLSTFAELTKQGIKTTEASTAIKAAITALINPSVDAKKKFDELGISSGISAVRQEGLFNILKQISDASKTNVDELTELIPNVRALTGVAALGEEALIDYDKILRAVNLDYGESSSLSAALSEQMETQSQKIKTLGGSFRALFIEVGGGNNTMNNTFKGITGGLKNVVDFLRQGFKAQGLYNDAREKLQNQRKGEKKDTKEINELTKEELENRIKFIELLGISGLESQKELLELKATLNNVIAEEKRKEEEVTKIQAEESRKITDKAVKEAAKIKEKTTKEELDFDLESEAENNRIFLEQQKEFDKEIIDQNDETQNAIDERNKKSYDEAIRLEQEKADKIALIVNALGTLVGGIADGLFDKGKLQREAEIEAITLKAQTGAISEEKAAKQIAAIKTKQAKADKKQAMFNIILSTAESVAKIWAQTGIFALAAQLPALVMGAARLAVVAAQPIPKFKEGTHGHYSTPSRFIAGEAGTEVLQDKSGRIKVVDKPTLFTNAQGMRVYSNPELRKISGSQLSLGKLEETTRSGHRDIVRSIKSIKQPIIQDGKKVGYSQSNYTRKYLELMTNGNRQN